MVSMVTFLGAGYLLMLMGVSMALPTMGGHIAAASILGVGISTKSDSPKPVPRLHR